MSAAAPPAKPKGKAKAKAALAVPIRTTTAVGSVIAALGMLISGASLAVVSISCVPFGGREFGDNSEVLPHYSLLLVSMNFLMTGYATGLWTQVAHTISLVVQVFHETC